VNFAGFLIVAMIVSLLAFAGFQGYFKPQKPQISNQAAETAPAPGQALDASSYSSSLDSIKKQLDSAARKEIDRVQEIEEGRI